MFFLLEMTQPQHFLKAKGLIKLLLSLKIGHCFRLCKNEIVFEFHIPLSIMLHPVMLELRRDNCY